MLTSKQRAYLRSLANNLDSVFQLGKGGVSPEVVEGVSQALEARELIKITVLNGCLEGEEELSVRQVAEMLQGRTRSEVVQVIGKKIVLYRKAKKNNKITFE